ncbi:MAG: cytochrome c maturation protein CcmE [Chloroflexi bacterium]|nr:cytochrome c maturation protein CcmE [Chloroflexota bacterium]
MNKYNDPISDEQPEGGPQESSATATTLFTPRMKVAVALTLFVGALGYFVFTTFDNATVYYLSVSEIEAGGPTEPDRFIRISGKLVEDSFVRQPNGFDALFEVQDEAGDVLAVNYSGEIGQVFFNPHSVIDLEGRYTNEGVFVTEHLVIKCPSKFLTQAERDELEGGTGAAPYQVVIGA